MLFDVMIIEDDLSARERLKSIIAWDDLSARLICEAEDSETAKELYELHHPKIIITDINIPIISGLELAKELQKEDPGLRFIVITGYNDFNFVKQSVAIQAIRLLSKPILPEEINDSIATAIRSLQEERNKENTYLMLEQLVASNLPEMQKTFMGNLLRKQPVSAAMVSKKMDQLKISLKGTYFLVSVVSLKHSVPNPDGQDTAVLLLQERLEQMAAEANLSCFSFFDDHFRLVLVVSAATAELDSVLERALIRLRSDLENTKDAKLYAGIGAVVTSPAELYLSHTGAMVSLNYRAIIGDDSISYFKDLQKMETPLSAPEPIWGIIRKRFRAGDSAAIHEAIANHIDFLSRQPGKDRLMQNFFFEYVMIMANEAVHMGLQMEQMECCASLMTQLFQSSDITDCSNDAISLADKLILQIQSQKSANSNYLISIAKDYIQENIHNKSLTLDQVSNHVGLSKNYFCMLFHQVVGINFSGYLKQERFARAKKLLRSTHLKVFEISEACGFSNAKYFSYIFKQTFGKTPLEYQREANIH